LESRQQLKNQLKTDKSIAAHEIACYLKSCCDQFAITIRPSQKQ
jgi:hypothetical protein